ncbi:MAG: 1-acyl-sn-glycerol-3-phosphate acyltransferase [Symploca sp. SIO2G7]|nr:1-acyl-sn-glycerol-3-phosphate acyltransferase [Symploca sp. SIO2G7]
MLYSTHHAQSKLEFIPPAFNPLVLKIAQWSLPFLLRFRIRRWLPAGITRIETTNVELLVDLYRQFQQGKIRFLIALRHSEVEDPLCMLHLLSYMVPKVARQQGISLQYPIHSHFFYERGMLLWAGDWLGWLFSGGGGIPIHRGRRIDSVAIRTSRKLFIDSKLPMAIAPEGATNNHSEIVSPLQPGVAQMGFWCVEDLLKANRAEQVLIVPISIRYRYIQPHWVKLDWLLSRLEADTGLPVQRIGKSASSDRKDVFYQRLFQLGEYLLSEMEQFYHQFYHKNFPEPTSISTEEAVDANQVLATRLQNLLNVALQVGEEYFGLPTKGTVIERCRKLEEAGWQYIYREDIPDLESLSPFQRGLADWIAQEASLRMRHMRLVESFVAVTGTYVKEKPTFERFAETALILFDTIARIKGQKIPHRPSLGKRSVQMTVGEPISVTQRWPVYQKNRQAAKQAIFQLTQDLQMALEEMIGN